MATNDGIFGFDEKGTVRFRVPVPGVLRAAYAAAPSGESGWAVTIDDSRILWLPRSPAAPARRLGRFDRTVASIEAQDIDADGVPEILVGTEGATSRFTT